LSWQILDTNSIWLKEFACALRRLTPTRNWCPEIRNFGCFEDWQKSVCLSDPNIEMIQFPLQRGYGRPPLAQVLPTGKMISHRMLRGCTTPELSPLMCTAPFYAPVAERWPGPVIYYLTDLTRKYAGMNEARILALDHRMCRIARAVCPNSSRIADYLCAEAGCDRAKVTVIPNATRGQNLLPAPLLSPAAPPEDLADLPRPIVGVIGNLASNMDWMLIADAVNKTSHVSWAFVGPTDARIQDANEHRAREILLGRGGRIRFLGRRKYGELRDYARTFDVALLPYKKHEPTYSGSATRFYEHLAACRPMLASRGFHELLSKEPLLKLVDTGDEIVSALDYLKGQGFSDGCEELRWRASQEGTWDVRARALMAAATQSDQAKVA
jgi:glycosyltransferase involved in cell wall biosynthesis